MPLIDFTSSPFTVLSAPSGGSITPEYDSGEGLQNLHFSAGAWELFLPLSHTDGEGVDDWYGTVRIHSDGEAVTCYCHLYDDSNDYGNSNATLFPLFPPAPHWSGPLNIGTADTDPGLTGFLPGGDLPSPFAIDSGFGLNVIVGTEFGDSFALGALDLTVLTSLRDDDGEGPPDDLDLALTEELVLIVADPSGLLGDPASPPPSGGSGQPKRFSDGAFLDSCDPSDARATVCTRTTRTIPAALSTHLQGECLTLAYCLRLVRRDGQVMGFTTHDADLAFDPGAGSTTFEALNSMSVTALRQELGATVGNLDLSGLIRSDRVTTTDLLAGRYDGAELTLYLVNWASVADGFVTLARGWFGAVTVVDGQWTAEYRSVAQRFQQQIVELTSPTCRVARFGDSRCKFNVTTVQFSRTVAAVTDNHTFAFASDSHASGYYRAGNVTFTSGDNAGLEREVKRHTHSGGVAAIELQESFPFTVLPGDTATLEAGCDRRLASCKRWDNVINFRGEPYVPGSGILKRVQSLVVVG